MSDFDSALWSLFVAGVTLVSIVACGLLLAALSRRKRPADPDQTGHVWDEDLAELNNPLPMWWIGLFWITIVFSLGYLWFFPGLGSYQGAAKWTSTGQYLEESDRPLAEVSELLGFSALSAFSRWHRTHYTCSASDRRRAARAGRAAG